MKNNYTQFIYQAMFFLLVFASFSISMPTAWLSIALGSFIILWLISGHYFTKFKLIISHPVALAAISLYLLYLLGFFYSSAGTTMKVTFLQKYTKLLLIPLVVSISPPQKIINYCLNAFLLGALILLIISYFKWLHIFPINIGIHDISDITQGYTAFKNRIAHNIIMSFALFLALNKFSIENKNYKWIWIFFAWLIFLNIMYLVNGRTGQVISLCLILLFIYKQKWLKKFFVIIGVALIAISIFKESISSLVPERLFHMHDEVSSFSSENGTSAGGRMEMYRNTIQLALLSPMYGHGTGALKEEYSRHAQKDGLVIKDVPNPHNQYILTFFELGFLGLTFFSYLFYQIWKIANTSSMLLMRTAVLGLSITFLLGCIFNSLLIDATEGRFFCLLTGILFSAYKPKKN